MDLNLYVGVCWSHILTFILILRCCALCGHQYHILGGQICSSLTLFDFFSKVGSGMFWTSFLYAFNDFGRLSGPPFWSSVGVSSVFVFRMFFVICLGAGWEGGQFHYAARCYGGVVKPHLAPERQTKDFKPKVQS